MPETLHALIAARLDGLPPAERRVVQDAAVLGKTFTKQALASLSEVPEAELEPILSSLARKEVFGVQADPRSPEHGQYGFLQDLLRKVAYETLAKADRKARHLAAAAFLEQALIEQEVVEVVASHYLAAYEAAPDAPDAAEIRAKAGEQLARAGERAASLGANEEAERYFAQAAELADDPVAEAELEERAGRRAWLGARGEQARAYLDRALAVFEAEGLTRRAARISAVLAEIDYREGHPPEAVARLEAALEALAGEEPDEDTAAVAAQLGRFLVLSNRHEDAAPRLEVALELAEALRLPEVFAQALTSKSILYTQPNRLEEARILLEGALELRPRQRPARRRDSRDQQPGGQPRVARPVPRRRRDLRRGARARPAGRRPGLGARSSSTARSARSCCSGNGTRRWRALDGLEAHRCRSRVASLVLRRRDRRLRARQLSLAARDGSTTSRPSRRPRTIRRSASGMRPPRRIVLRAEGRPHEALAAAELGVAVMADGSGSTFLNVKLCFVEALEAAFDARRHGEGRGAARHDRVASGRASARRCSRRTRTGSARSSTGDETGSGPPRRSSASSSSRSGSRSRCSSTARRRPDDALVAEAREIFERLGATPWLERAGGVGDGVEVGA